MIDDVMTDRYEREHRMNSTLINDNSMLRAAHQLVKKLTIEEAKFNDRILRGLSLVEREQLLHMLSLIKKAISEFDAPGSDVDVE